MPQWIQWILIVTGVLVIALLGRFIWQRSRLLQQQSRQQARNLAFQNERREQMIQSIRVLAMSIEQDQVEYSEACLRIKGLLDHLAPDLLSQSPYRIFQEMHDALQHMPTHQARQDTASRFIDKMDAQRFELERKHADAIRRAATAIRYHTFPDIQGH
ncbi:hypothetical protein RE428_07100 [Marinobacter nanhaiticus D15-8W]|uniref:DUF2489 domain-containing protein n=1 Tax=Marinobacter nanhaiticus D15-8W TaxID=626887 RepID=N6WUC0_9GAMM|nr:DUF2489 domain-containing protein [Marinobacter nanhaiticus]ENO14622.1 DUF2489 domain-containing protein [Marinobacter nanhaiticus D15-8W]BES69692.1 hypothetical protein RE428_07100 [Marinobacter nanhaiticus D15-8W]